VDEVSLAFIAFAAGSELYLEELRHRIKSIAWVTTGLVVVTFTLGSLAMFLMADYIPFMQTMPATGRIAVSILTATILVARSPSAAIAIVKEVRARGPFTQTVLGVTVVMDVAVITLFAISSSAADALLANLGLDLSVILLLLAELLLAAASGYAISRIIRFILSLGTRQAFKAAMILLTGYGVFVFSEVIRHLSHENLPFEVLLEPLLICMVGSFLVTNYSKYRHEFLQILHDYGLPIYVAFFTLTGASLSLDVLAKTWPIALALFAVRLIAISIGSFGGGVLAGEPTNHNRIRWMAFVTQAGVALGLAKEVAVEFPPWGSEFATLIIALVVLNEMVGPLFFKWTIHHVGEAHLRADTSKFNGVYNVIIFGPVARSLALARQLVARGWHTKIATPEIRKAEEVSELDIPIYPISKLNLEALRALDAERAQAIVSMLSDEENYQICALAYENFGTGNLVVQLNHRANAERFQELGASCVEPATAMISLLAHFVRSPSGASLLLGMEENQNVADFVILNPNLHGIALRDLRLPLDTLILSIRRHGHTLFPHGYTHLEVGDWVTVIGSPESLEELDLRFAA